MDALARLAATATGTLALALIIAQLPLMFAEQLPDLTVTESVLTGAPPTIQGTFGDVSGHYVIPLFDDDGQMRLEPFPSDPSDLQDVLDNYELPPDGSGDTGSDLTYDDAVDLYNEAVDSAYDFPWIG